MRYIVIRWCSPSTILDVVTVDVAPFRFWVAWFTNWCDCSKKNMDLLIQPRFRGLELFRCLLLHNWVRQLSLKCRSTDGYVSNVFIIYARRVSALWCVTGECRVFLISRSSAKNDDCNTHTVLFIDVWDEKKFKNISISMIETRHSGRRYCSDFANVVSLSKWAVTQSRQKMVFASHGWVRILKQLHCVWPDAGVV